MNQFKRQKKRTDKGLRYVKKYRRELRTRGGLVLYDKTSRRDQAWVSMDMNFLTKQLRKMVKR